MFEQNIGVGHQPAIGADRDIGQVGEEGGGGIDLGEDRFDQWRRAGNPAGIAVDRQLAVRRIDLGIGLDRGDSVAERALDQIASGQGQSIDLPGEEEMLWHSFAKLVATCLHC
ncbi:MAG: hypothetical protein KGM93_14595 [Sphingomonadales bacterium]|nr:hypothetical protein [Sphingomonadales bacterium]